ncbi:hypothetical protein CYMTET_36483 [Cymbomonas tetramitiformis]|uniref:Uncharacterized protein n=1 Tax=Cymbomonas tetramitiformis TaxID=36881 RepID=A0AAE0CH80_9CHLO|nr:hypothetical protein CYMTET_36483 [Cymbomonas tetramitiformis]
MLQRCRRARDIIPAVCQGVAEGKLLICSHGRHLLAQREAPHPGSCTSAFPALSAVAFEPLQRYQRRQWARFDPAQAYSTTETSSRESRGEDPECGEVSHDASPKRRVLTSRAARQDAMDSAKSAPAPSHALTARRLSWCIDGGMWSNVLDDMDSLRSPGTYKAVCKILGNSKQTELAHKTLRSWGNNAAERAATWGRFLEVGPQKGHLLFKISLQNGSRNHGNFLSEFEGSSPAIHFLPYVGSRAEWYFT